MSNPLQREPVDRQNKALYSIALLIGPGLPHFRLRHRND